MNPSLEELATLYVLDRLEPGERAAFESELLRSPELAALVRELEAALAREIRSLPRHAPAADLFARLESRLDRPSVPPDVNVVGGAPSRLAVASAKAGPRPARPADFSWAAFARWGIAAVIALSVATLAVQSLRRSSGPAPRPVVLIVGLESHGGGRVEMPLPPAARADEGSFVQLAALAETFWNDPQKLPVVISASGQSAHGYALFDPASNQGFIAFRHLPEPAPGHRYCLWIVDTATGRVTEAGALPAADTTSGLYSFAVASPAAAKPAELNFIVTAEDANAKPAEPHGKVVLGSKRI